VTGYASERTSQGCSRGSPWLEAAVHVEALAAAWAEGIWQWRHELEVDGAGSVLRKLRWTGAQLLAVVTRPGARRSGLATEWHP
jgi:hypothetical protein